MLGEEKGPSFVNAAQKWVEKVASNRSKAVNALEVSFKALVAQPSPTGAPVDALQNLLELAYKDGVGHESYVLESGESGAAYLEKVRTASLVRFPRSPLGSSDHLLAAPAPLPFATHPLATSPRHPPRHRSKIGSKSRSV